MTEIPDKILHMPVRYLNPLTQRLEVVSVAELKMRQEAFRAGDPDLADDKIKYIFEIARELGDTDKRMAEFTAVKDSAEFKCIDFFFSEIESTLEKSPHLLIAYANLKNSAFHFYDKAHMETHTGESYEKTLATSFTRNPFSQDTEFSWRIQATIEAIKDGNIIFITDNYIDVSDGHTLMHEMLHSISADTIANTRLKLSEASFRSEFVDIIAFAGYGAGLDNIMTVKLNLSRQGYKLESLEEEAMVCYGTSYYAGTSEISSPVNSIYFEKIFNRYLTLLASDDEHKNVKTAILAQALDDPELLLLLSKEAGMAEVTGIINPLIDELMQTKTPADAKALEQRLADCYHQACGKLEIICDRFNEEVDKRIDRQINSGTELEKVDGWQQRSAMRAKLRESGCLRE